MYERKTVDIVISDEFRDFLEEIQADSVVAKLLLKRRLDKSELVDNPINFISIAHDNLRISYLTHDRIENLDPSVYWSTKRRFATKPGAFVGKILKNIPAKDVEKFSNLFKSRNTRGKFNFKIVEGDDILTYYHISSYAAEKGTLGSSCMKHDFCQGYFGIYTQNPEKVKMLVMLNDDDKLMGRALLWNCGEFKLMDRVYTIADEEFLFQFKKWATKNGYLYKSEQNWFNTLCFENLTTLKKEYQFNIKLDNYLFRKYPYVDTFKFIEDETGIVRNHIIKENVDFKTMCGSDGGRQNWDFLVLDEIDRVMRHRGDTVLMKYLGIRTHYDNTRYSESNDDYILTKDAKHSQEANDFIFNEEYDKYNNYDVINDRIKRNRERLEEVELYRSRRRRADVREISREITDYVEYFISDWVQSPEIRTAVIDGYLQSEPYGDYAVDAVDMPGNEEPINQ